MSAPLTVMHHVLAIPELLDTVFSKMDQHSNFTNALVSRVWSEIALDNLWREVNDLHRLFNLLGPLRKANSGEYEFSRPPDANDWARFHRYSKRVQELAYDEGESEDILSQNAFYDIARTRVSQSLLPNMHTLNWRASIPLCVMFMHSNIKKFVIHLPDVIESTSLQSFFNDVVARMPNITYLDVQTSMPMKLFEANTIELLSSLPKLEYLILPRFCLTSRIAECLSRLPKLGCVSFEYFEEQGIGNPNDIIHFRPRLSEGAFSSLYDLSFTATYTDTERLLTIPFSPSNLTALYVDSPNLETLATIHELLTAVSKSCPLLTALTLISPRRVVDTGVGFGTSSDRALQSVSLETIKSIFTCANLTRLEIIHQYPLNLTQDDLEMMAMQWPLLETVNLNNEPFYFHSPELTFEALFPFARHCPHLVCLGILIDASRNVIPCSSPTSPFPSFKSLQSLSVGLSKITESTPVAVFLSQLLPLSCRIDSGNTWDESYEYSQESKAVVSERLALWVAANSLLPILVGVRLEEREKANAAKQELDS